MDNRKWESAKPYFAMVCLQFGYAGMNLIAKVVLDYGMSHYVLVVYRHAFATASLAPFALLSERKARPKMTFPIFMQIFVLSLLGPVIDQNLYYVGLKLTSPTFSCAVSSIVPAVTFIIAILCRMEKVEMRKARWQAKVVGTVVTVVGTMVMIMYKGPLMVNNFWSDHVIHPPVLASGDDWLRASVFLILASLSWASFFILQAATLKKYPAHVSLSAMVCFMGTLNSTAVALVMERTPSAWNIGFDMNFLASAYAGIVTSSIAYYVQGLKMQHMGPVFVSSFNPLVVIIVSIMSFFILGETIFLGRVLGILLLMVGLCTVLWGKHREAKEDIDLETVKCCNGGGNSGLKIMPRIEEGEEEDDEDVEKQSTAAGERSPAPVVVFCCHYVENTSSMATKDAPRA